MRTRLILLFTTILCGSAWDQTYTIKTLAGGALPINIPGTSASLGYGVPQYIAADPAGNVFFVDQNTVLRLDATTGSLTLLAGNGTQGFSGDNGPATSAQLNSPTGVAVDSNGNLYIADFGDSRIRKVSNAVITTVAGNATPGFSGDKGPATGAQLANPYGLAIDNTGNVYIADSSNNLVRKVSNGIITTVAGNGTPGYSGDNGLATSAQLSSPAGVAIDSAGNLYIAES
jgi:sugar lactone lactonase YvrE